MNHPKAAKQFAKDNARVHWHDQALWLVRQKRDSAAQEVPEWEELRLAAAEIKSHTLSRLDHYLKLFEKKAMENGIVVHWAKNAESHNRIVYEILNDRGVSKLVKSKSMLTEECGLNPYLEERDIEVIDTDLGERIIQLRNEPPSHIVLPAIHLKREDVGDLFRDRLNTEEGNNDPTYLTAAARKHLRDHFHTSGAGLSGVNFAVAETGGVVLCTNEGNGDLGATLPPIHIACMGIEKLIPNLTDLAVFVRMLARNATGQPITAYTSHYNKPKPGGEMHVVIVDNGRSDILLHPEFRNSLRCIRCGACLNTCPVYRRSGGHSYGYPIPGPIGSISAPHHNPKKYYSLPYASTLCGSCNNVCPVHISLHEQLLEWRKVMVREKRLGLTKRVMMWGMGFVLVKSWNYRVSTWWAKIGLRIIPRWMIHRKWNPWTRDREMPRLATKRFREIYRETNRIK